MNFADKLSILQLEIEKHSRTANRNSSDVRILAVSKKQTVDSIREAYRAGQRHFGENYVQELIEKAEALKDLTDISWHLIGPLQTNKLKRVFPIISAFHALDSVKLVDEFEKRFDGSGRKEKLDVFIQVNVDDEKTKSGVSPKDVSTIAKKVIASKSLKLRGLMCIPAPIEANQKSTPRNAFKTMHQLAMSIKRDLNITSLELSMGMSDDYGAAIEEGSNWIRVGRSLFGERK